MKERAASVVVAACVVWAGCGQPEDRTPGGTGGPGAPLTAAEFGAELDEEFAEVLCRGAFECPGQIDTNTVALLRRYPSQGECVDGVLADFGVRFADGFLDSIEGGRVGYDEAEGGKCLAALDTTLAGFRCGLGTIGLDEIPECAGVFTGLTPRGEACLDDLDCEEGDFCQESATTCYGACAEITEDRGGGGREPCGEVVCEVEEFCQPQADGSQQCAPKLGLGEMCRRTDDCTKERPDAGCLPDGEASARGVCAAYGSLGEGGACRGEDLWCEEGLVCDPGTKECTSNATFALGAQGEPCDEEAVCGTGLACVFTIGLEGVTRSCEPPRAEGEACAIESECEPGLTCLGTNLEADPPELGACGARKAAGQACAGASECASFTCEEGQCVAAEVCEVP
jgi:hypothetical protein